MTAFVRDLRLAVRVLLGTKAWTLVVLLSLALGIGANTALFTAVNGLLLQTVSVHEPERLVRFNHAGRNDMVRNSNDYGYSGTSGTRNVRSTFSFPMIEQLRAANTTLTGLAAGVPMGSLNVLVNGDAQLATGYQATGNYFTVIGVPAVVGRVFGEADDRPSAPPVAVISHAYWSKRFAGEPSAIGRAVSINGQMVTIVGVTPADFAGIERLGADAPDVTVPLAFDALFAPPVRAEIPRMQQPTYWWLQLVGRLKPGVPIEQARANFEETMYMMDVSPAFFATMGIPVLQGRSFTDRDGPTGPKMAILNEAAARRLFPDGHVLGRRIGESFEKSGEMEVVGVVRDTKYASVRDPGPPTMYRCVWQTTQRNLHVVLRTAGEPLAMSETVRAALREIDPTLPVQEFTSQREQISQRFAQERLFARAYAAFGALAVLLACIGLFGLMSYNVARRTGEIGVRMALGAQRRTVVGMVMRESIRLVAIGIVLGLAAVLWAGRFVQTVVYGLSPSDPPTIGAAVALIAVVTALAGGLPARRASNVNPIEALRQQ